MAFDPVTAVVDLIKTGLDKFVPDKMDEKDKESLKQNMEMFAAKEARDENSQFRDFVLKYEGSAADYAKIPIVGPIMMLIRGLVRPGFTYGTFYFDYLFFTSLTEWPVEKAKLLATINLIVLLFWFGEKILVNTGLSEVLLKVFVKK